MVQPSKHRRPHNAPTSRAVFTFAGGSSNVCDDGLGDNGPATAACLNFPNGLAIAGPSNLYISDAGHKCVRLVDASATITTVAGRAGVSCNSWSPASEGGRAVDACFNAPKGLAIHPSTGALLIADSGLNSAC